MITIGESDFDVALEYSHLKVNSPRIGAIVTFTGLVREFCDGHGTHLQLEHYPGMTEKVLATLVERAKKRWPITEIRIIHRVGRLSLGEHIVFIGVSSPHRKAAFHACEFIIDFLKTDAPFWKKEITHNGESWVEAKTSDANYKQEWLSSNHKHGL